MADISRRDILFRRLKNSSLIRPLAGTAGANALAIAFGALGSILLARRLGPFDRGELVTVLVWPTFVGLIALLGLPQAVCYLISKNRRRAPAVIASVSMGCFLLSLVVGLAGSVAAPFIGRNHEVDRLMTVVFLTLPLYTTPVTWVASLQAVDFRLWNIARLIQPTLYFSGIATLFASDLLDLQTAVFALILSLVGSAVVVAILTLRMFGRPTGARLSVWNEAFSFGVRTGLANAALLVNGRLDQLVLSLMVPPAVLGQYSVAVSLSLVASPASVSFGYVAFPRIAAAKSRREAVKLERLAIRGSLVAATCVLIPLAIAAPWLIPTLFGSGFEDAALIFLVLAPATILLLTNQVKEEILRGRGLPGITAWAEGIGALVTALLLVIFVPEHGVFGAVLASFVAYTAVTLMLNNALKKSHGQAPVS